MSRLPVSLDDVLNSIPAGPAPMLSASPEMLGGGDCEDDYGPAADGYEWLCGSDVDGAL